MRVGRYTIEITHPDKILFPSPRLTKQDLVEYYQQIAPTMLPYVRGRPVTMERPPRRVVFC